MSWFEDARKAVADTSALLVRSGPRLLQLIVRPAEFYSRKVKTREVVAVLAVNATLLAAIHFFVIKSIAEVEDPSLYAVGAVLFNVLHLMIMASALAAPGAVFARSIPFATHLANALFALAILPIVSVLTVTATRLRATAALAGDLHPALWQDMFVLVGYLCVSYRMYQALRVNAASSRLRAAAAATTGLAAVLTVMATNLVPNQGMLLQAWTK